MSVVMIIRPPPTAPGDMALPAFHLSLGLGPADHPPGPYLKPGIHLHPQFP